jgi:threonine/homoserine/homoserine lactone efflux protein
MLTYLIFGITYGFIAAVQPGPLQTYIIAQTIKKDWRSTLPASFAPIISDGPIFILVIFLLNTLPESFIFGLRICGGIFLLYLGFNAYKSWKEFIPDISVSKNADQKTLFGAVVVNLLNPNPYLGWSLIMGPLFLEGWQNKPFYGILLVIGFYTTIALFLAVTVILFAYARKLGPRVSKVMLGLSSAALFAFGFYQLWIGIRYFK